LSEDTPAFTKLKEGMSERSAGRSAVPNLAWLDNGATRYPRQSGL